MCAVASGSWGFLGRPASESGRLCHGDGGMGGEGHRAHVPRDIPFAFRIGERMALVCWGVMPSGMLRHPALHWPPGNRRAS